MEASQCQREREVRIGIMENTKVKIRYIFPEGNSYLTTVYLALVNEQKSYMQINIPKYTKTAFFCTWKEILCLTLPNKLRIVPKMLDWTVCQLVSIYY